MLGGMQEWELRVSSLIDHAARAHPMHAIVGHRADGTMARTNWGDLRRDALRLVQALRRLDIYPQDRVATMARNHERHLASWFGITGAGCILHPIDPRLTDDQLDTIVNHAGDRVLIYDFAFQPVVERMRRRWPGIEHYVCFDDPRPAVIFADWIAVEDGNARWSPGDERAPCMLHYTGAGRPAGFLHSTRSIVLQSLATIQPACLGIEPRSRVLPGLPMFDARSAGLPWACAATGAGMVLSERDDPAVLSDLVRGGTVTLACGTPDLWLALFEQAWRGGLSPPALERALAIGTVMPSEPIEWLLRGGVRVVLAWGPADSASIVTVSYEQPDRHTTMVAQQSAPLRRQSPLYGCEVRTLSGPGVPGLQVRGPWTLKRYFEADEDATDHDQWLDTGVDATISADGSLRLEPR